ADDIEILLRSKMKKIAFAIMVASSAFAGMLRAQPSPGVAYDLRAQFDPNANPSISGWSYRAGMAYGGGLITQTIDPNWNSGDFGPGQPGYDGTQPGAHAGWAQRVDNGVNPTPNGAKDIPVGDIIGYRNSALLTIRTTDPGGVANLSGNLWNLRQFGRSGAWQILHNDT